MLKHYKAMQSFIFFSIKIPMVGYSSAFITSEGFTQSTGPIILHRSLYINLPNNISPNSYSSVQKCSAFKI